MPIVDSKQQMLTVEEIIRTAAQDTKTTRSDDDVFNMLMIELGMPNIWKCRAGNSLFVVHKSKTPGYGYFRGINADIARNYVENSRAFMVAAYKVGFDVIVTQFQDPTVLNIFKIIARDKPADMGFAVQRTNTQGYQVTLKLGKPRGDQA
jgi:hypothetical protein